MSLNQFWGKFIGKLRTKNFEAHFHRKLRTLEKFSNVKKLRTAEPQPIFTGSCKKKEYSLVANANTNTGFIGFGFVDDEDVKIVVTIPSLRTLYKGSEAFGVLVAWGSGQSIKICSPIL